MFLTVWNLLRREDVDNEISQDTEFHVQAKISQTTLRKIIFIH